jgi:hypothetical protein
MHPRPAESSNTSVVLDSTSSLQCLKPSFRSIIDVFVRTNDENQADLIVIDHDIDGSVDTAAWQ